MTLTAAPDAFEQAFQEVQKLAADFDANKAHYLSPGYQEQEARQDFIDKFWTALGWDVTHDIQKNPYAQEVKVERSVTMSEGRKRADYAFYLDPDFKNPRFFVEAKKPSVEIANKDSYFQALRYGWNGGTPLAVLTDFEQFHVLDSRARPDIDTALSHAVQKYHYTDYADRDKFGAIYWLFSREAVAAGEMDKYVAAHMPKAPGKFLQRGLFHGGHQGIDESFLRELDEYRWTLARAFHAANPSLDSETLTEATQRVLDRLVFIRFLEDKLIEPEPMVAHFGDKGKPWAGFLAASRRLDTVYNGNIFKPHLIDSPKFHAPDAVFGQVCSDLSSEQSPYLFSLIPIHILGSIYERFLGKVIVVDEAGAKVEEKPEVRKAGGVYYTPDYIVRYIVDNTVGKQIADKTPAEIAALRFADIACGSGSFLLGVYDVLLRAHTTYYNAKAKGRTAEARKAGCEEREGVWHLSLWQKRQILLDNVWGVDIDAQAVEVAQMSLYLKLLEEETTATARDQNLLHGAILPTLNKNIVFGNSLIGTDILQDTLFEPAEERKLNPLDFKQAFPQIMKNGGFDAIVGNPPYIQLSMAEFRNVHANTYLKATYGFSGGRLNTFAFFLEQARLLTRGSGKFSYIVPNTILSQESYEELRQRIVNLTTIEAIAVPHGTIFKDAVVETVVLVMENGPRNDTVTAPHLVKFLDLAQDKATLQTAVAQSELAENYKASFLVPLVQGFDGIKNTVLKLPAKFGDILNINQAIALKYDRAACLTQTRVSEKYQQMLDGRHINRYVTGDSPNYFKFDVSKIHSCKREDIFLLPEKIFFRRVGDRLIGSLDNQQKFALNTLIVISPKPNCHYNLRFVLGIFNSTLANFFYVTFLKSSKKVFSEIQARQVEQIPIPKLDFADPADKAQHDKMVKFVEQMLTAKKERANALTDRDMDYWQRRCDTLDRQIDELVYELYGLTDDEIALVEGTNAAA